MGVRPFQIKCKAMFSPESSCALLNNNKCEKISQCWLAKSSAVPRKFSAEKGNLEQKKEI